MQADLLQGSANVALLLKANIKHGNKIERQLFSLALTVIDFSFDNTFKKQKKKKLSPCSYLMLI